MASESVGTTWSWSLPTPEEFTTAAIYFNNRPRPRAVRTLAFKLHNPSKRRTRLLLEAHAFVTNATAELYNMWHEDAAVVRRDGAIAAIFSTASENTPHPYSARKLDLMLEHRGKERVAALQGFHNSIVSHGLYRQCSETLVSWLQRQRDLIPSRVKQNHGNASVGSLEEFYESWHHMELTYQQAMSIVASLSLPINQRRPQPFVVLERRSKREARWILGRLQPLDKLQAMKHTLEAYLDEEPSSGQRQALVTNHLWKTETKRRSRVREGWWWQRSFEYPDSKRVIGELSSGEIELFYREIQEMIAHLEHTDQLIASYPELAQDAILHECQTADERLKHILTIFLRRKPHAYPQIERVQLRDDPDHPGLYRVLSQKAGMQELPEVLYERRLRWFQIDHQHPRSVDQILSEQREADEVQGMFAALRLTRQPKLQPLRLDGHARPARINEQGELLATQNRYFALLYDPTSGRLILALFIHRHGGPPLTEEEQKDQARREAQHRQYAQRRKESPLYFVNAPDTPFIPAKDSSVLLFPLECGDNYHMRLIRQFLEEQRQAQCAKQKHLQQTLGYDVPIERCYPDTTPIRTAHILCEWQDNLPVFNVHITVELRHAENAALPQHVLAIGSFDGEFTYAVLDINGTPHCVKDLHIPRHVDPRLGRRRSKNFVHEVANEIIALAWQWNALIVLEDRSRKHAQISTARSANRSFINQPIQRLAHIVSYKALAEGLWPPRLISNLSSRDCPGCKTRHSQNEHLIQNRWSVHCPECNNKLVVLYEQQQYLCSSCRHTWDRARSQLHQEKLFRCPTCCQEPTPSRGIRTLVLAQRGLTDLVTHYQRSRDKTQKSGLHE